MAYQILDTMSISASIRARYYVFYFRHGFPLPDPCCVPNSIGSVAHGLATFMFAEVKMM